jgi:hypothetical protein
MKIRTFKNGCKSGWEINFIGKVFNFRIAKYQLSVWKNYNPIINLKW